MLSLVVNIVIILGAALLLGLGFVLQQSAASTAPPEDSLRLRLLLDLLAQPRWLVGIGCMVGGQVLGAVALGHADVTLVEPLLTTNLIFALALARLLSAQHLGPREWCGAAVLSAGVGLFVAAGDPRGGGVTVSGFQGWLVIVVIAALAGLLVSMAQRRTAMSKAVLLAAGAGCLFGLQDGFTRHAVTQLDDGGVSSLIHTWQPYAVIVVALLGILLAQSAFEAAPLQASLPAMTVAEPVCGMAFGVGAFGEIVRDAPLDLALESLGILAMLAGVVMLARSPHLHQHLVRPVVR